jgi:hypothetical protein
MKQLITDQNKALAAHELAQARIAERKKYIHSNQEKTKGLA